GIGITGFVALRLSPRGDLKTHQRQFFSRSYSGKKIPQLPQRSNGLPPTNQEKLRICASQIADGGRHHSITAAPHVNPAPNTIRRIKSPRRTIPEVTASSRAIATDAAEVFPYL